MAGCGWRTSTVTVAITFDASDARAGPAIHARLGSGEKSVRLSAAATAERCSTGLTAASSASVANLLRAELRRRRRIRLPHSRRTQVRPVDHDRHARVHRFEESDRSAFGAGAQNAASKAESSDPALGIDPCHRRGRIPQGDPHGAELCPAEAHLR